MLYETLCATLSPEISVATRSAIEYGKDIVSYVQFKNAVDKMIMGLHAYGIGENDKLAVVGGNVPEMLYLYFAASYLNFSIVFIEDLIDATVSEIREMLDDASPTWILLDDTKSHKVRGMGFTEIQKLPLQDLCDRKDEHNFLPAKAPLSNDIRIYAYTSGTASKRKAVCLTEEVLLLQAINVGDALKITGTSRVLLSGYLYSMGALPLSLATLLCGACCVIPKQKGNLFDTIEQERISHIRLNPCLLEKITQNNALDDRELATLKCVAYGSAPTPNSVIEKVKELIKCDHWVQGYGLTETCGPITWLSHRDSPTRIDSVGKPSKDMQIRVISQTGESLPAGEVGEISIKGPILMSGYWDSDKQSVITDIFKAGWFNTGDLGQVDEQGYLYIKGRQKDCIVLSNGYTIYPSEIESLIQSLPEVEETAVVGMQWQGSEVPVAVISATNQNRLYGKIRKLLMGKISVVKWPKFFIVIHDKLPRNKNMKLIKRIIRNDVITLRNSGLLLPLIVGESDES